MNSRLADMLTAESYEAVMALTPDERIDLAFRLGDDQLADYMEAHGVTRDEAMRYFRRRSQEGRRDSKCMREINEL